MRILNYLLKITVLLVSFLQLNAQAAPVISLQEYDDALVEVQNAFYTKWSEHNSTETDLNTAQTSLLPALIEGAKHFDLLLPIPFYRSYFRYREKYGEDVFNRSVVRAVAKNYIGASGVASLFGSSAVNLEELFLFSSLHPLTDDPLDAKFISERTMSKITHWLNGEVDPPSSFYEKMIYDILEKIYLKFSPQKHPVFYKILRQLHQAQIASTKVQNQNATEKELIEVAFMKGALSACAGLYIAMNGMSTEQFKAALWFGGMLQILDDKKDVLIDQKEGIETVFVREIRVNRSILNASQSTLGLHEQVLSALRAFPSVAAAYRRYFYREFSILHLMDYERNIGLTISDPLKKKCGNLLKSTN